MCIRDRGLTACAGGSSAPASSAAPASAADPAASADAASAQGEAEGSKTDNTGTDVKASYTLNIGSAMSSTHPSSIALQLCIRDRPVREDNPLLGAKNSIITPHIAWAPRESRQRLMNIAVSNLKAFMEGNPVNVVS